MLCFLIILGYPVVYEGLCSHLRSLNIPLALHGQTPHDQTRQARHPGMRNSAKMVKFTEDSAIKF